jgi:peptide/nickel transport system substrate-binding protein
VVGAGALLMACLIPGMAIGGGAAAPAAAADKTIFTVGMINEVDSFNPFLGIEATSYEAWALTYDFMVGYKMEDMSPAPALATDWTTSKDGRTWTFDIRDDITWSDGEPLTAEDIAYTYNRVIDGGPEATTWSSYLKGVTKASAPDATHVVLELDQPNAVLPLLPIPIIPEHVWKDVSEDQVKTYPAEPVDGQPVVGSGPFQLAEGTAGGSTYRFVKNPDYWGGEPHVDEVVIRVFKNEDTMIQALIKGEIDFAEDISPLQVESLQKEPGITAQNGESPSFDEIAFNSGSIDTETGKPIGDPNPAVLDPKFRHALGYALDLDQIVRKVYQGGAVPGDTIIPPAYPDYRWEPPEDEAFTFDLDKAGQLLDEAGYTMGSDGLRTMPDGSPIGTLRLAARTDASLNSSVNTMDYFKEWLADLGIKAEVQTFESGRLTEVILDGNFDAFQWNWYVEPDPDSMLSNMTCDQRGGWSDSWYCDKQYDQLYEKQHVEMDQAAREEQVKKMQQILFEDSPYLVTAYTTIGEAVRSDRFACFQSQPDPGGVWLVQYGGHNYASVRPASEAGDCDGVTTALQPTSASSDDGTSTGFWIAIGAAAVVLVGAGGFVMVRRRATVGERE